MFDHVEFLRVDFTGADLSGVEIKHSKAEETSFSFVLVRDATIRDFSCSKCGMQDATITRTKIYGSDLSKARMDRTTFSNADVWRTNLEESTLTQAVISKSVFAECRLDAAVLDASRWSDTSLARTHFSSASSLVNVEFDGVGFEDVNLEEVNVRRVRWRSYNLAAPQGASYDSGGVITTYLLLAHSYREYGDLRTANEFRYRAEVLRTKSLGVGGWARGLALGLTFGYGCRPFRLVLWAGFLLLACAPFYYIWSHPWLSDGTDTARRRSWKSLLASGYFLLQFVAVFVSNVPDVLPRHEDFASGPPRGFARVVAAVEAAIGVYLATLALWWIAATINDLR